VLELTPSETVMIVSSTPDAPDVEHFEVLLGELTECRR
jgi:hypothetical protein